MPELKTRLHWLMGLRVVVVTLMLGLSLAFHATRGEFAVTFSALIIFTYLITIVYALMTRYLTAARSLTVFTWVQVGMDFVLETILVARTGGIESPFVVLYVITVTVASLVPRRRVGIGDGSRLHDIVWARHDRFSMSVFSLLCLAGARASLRDRKRGKRSACMAWHF